MSEFLVKSKYFTTKHIWFDTECEKNNGGGTINLQFMVPPKWKIELAVLSVLQFLRKH